MADVAVLGFILFCSIAEFADSDEWDSALPRESCQIAGDASVYGLGVRLGYYLQFLAAVLAPYLAPDALENICLAFGSFTLALFITVFKHASEGTFIAVEWHIVAFLTLFLGMATFYFSPGARTITEETGGMYFAGPLFRVDFYAGGSIRRRFYGSWGLLCLLSSFFLLSSPWMYWSGRHIGHVGDCPVYI